jgi:hypothetical protein
MPNPLPPISGFNRGTTMNTKNRFNPIRYLASALIAISIVVSLRTVPAWAAPSPVGTWSVAGNVSVIAKFPQLVNSTTTLNAKTLGMKLTYGEDRSFGSSLLGLEGTWTQTGNKVNIDLSRWMEGIKASVLSLLPANTVVDVAKASFTAKVISDNKLTGNFKLIINATVPGGSSLGGTTLANDIKGRITLSGVLSNTRAPAEIQSLGINAATAETLPVDILNRVIGTVFFYQLFTQ